MVNIYCDPMFPCVPNANWRYSENCHLFTDAADLETLHAFAARIGLRRAWFQHTPGRLPHYDLTRAKRAQAIRAGAISLTRNEAVEKWRAIRSGVVIEPLEGQRPSPACFAFMDALFTDMRKGVIGK